MSKIMHKTIYSLSVTKPIIYGCFVLENQVGGWGLVQYNEPKNRPTKMHIKTAFGFGQAQ